MANANQADFLGEGAFAPQQQLLTPEEEAIRQRNLAINEQRVREEQARRTAAANAPYLRERGKNQAGGLYIGEDARQRELADQRAGITGRTYRTPAEQQAWEKTHQRGFAGNLIRDPVTMGILAAPAVITGAGAAMGGLAAGGAGTMAGGTMGGASIAAPTIAETGTILSPFGPGMAAPIVGEPFAMASPFAAGAAGAAGAFPAAAGAAAAGAGGMQASDWIAGGALGLAGINAAKSLLGKSGAEKKLLAKQEEMAAEAATRRRQMDQQRLNQLGKSVLALNPLNSAMAAMYGPESAFSPQQMAGLVADPGAMSDAEHARQREMLNQGQLNQRQAENLALEEQRRREDQARQARVQAAFAPPGPGPAPINMPRPAPAQRF